MEDDIKRTERITACFKISNRRYPRRLLSCLQLLHLDPDCLFYNYSVIIYTYCKNHTYNYNVIPCFPRNALRLCQPVSLTKPSRPPCISGQGCLSESPSPLLYNLANNHQAWRPPPSAIFTQHASGLYYAYYAYYACNPCRPLYPSVSPVRQKKSRN